MLPKAINIADAAARQIQRTFDPHLVADVNDAQVKVAKFGAAFDWHSHPDGDEAFFMLKGQIAIDFREGVVELGEGDFLNVPRGIEHRPRSLSEEPVVVMFERAGTVNTGDATDSALTVTDLKWLQP